jgi:hypothetical protein
MRLTEGFIWFLCQRLAAIRFLIIFKNKIRHEPNPLFYDFRHAGGFFAS